MAETTHTRRLAWEKTYNTYSTLNQQLALAQRHERDALERAVAAREEDLLELPAPSWAALRFKLGLLWSCQLDGLDGEAEARRLVLEDVDDLIAEQALLLGATA